MLCNSFDVFKLIYHLLHTYGWHVANSLRCLQQILVLMVRKCNCCIHYSMLSLVFCVAHVVNLMFLSIVANEWEFAA
jgi:hypothetical protein